MREILREKDELVVFIFNRLTYKEDVNITDNYK